MLAWDRLAQSRGLTVRHIYLKTLSLRAQAFAGLPLIVIRSRLKKSTPFSRNGSLAA